MIVFTIYCHTCTVTGKKYVGQTKQKTMTRWSEHISRAKRTSSTQVFMRALRKYSEEQWTHEILATVSTQEEANASEIEWIARLQTIVPNGYNIDSGGKNPARPTLGAKLKAAFDRKPEDQRRAQVAQMDVGYKDWLLRTTPEQRSQISRDARNSLPAEQRSEIAKRGKANMSPEARRAAGIKGKANMTPEARRAVRAKQIADTTAEQRSESARKGAASLTPEQMERRRENGRHMAIVLHSKRTPESDALRLEAVRAGWAAKSQEEKDEAALKRSANWEAKTKEEQEEITRRRVAGISPEARKERSQKAWVTKRLKSALKSHDFTLIGRPEVPAAPNGG